MRSPLLLSFVVSGCLATGCAGGGRGVVDAGGSATGVAPAMAVAPTAGRDWFLDAEGPDVRLAYGAETSDDLRLALSCVRGGGMVTLETVAGPGDPREIHVESGGETERFMATAEDDPLHDGLFLTALTDTAQPVLKRFAQVGWIAVWRGERREVMAPQSAQQGQVREFFSQCG